MKEMRWKSLKPSPWCLFETIKGLLESTNMIREDRIYITLWLNHVYLLLQDTMKQSISSIQLSERPIELDNKRENNSDSRRLDHRAKGLSKSIPYCWWKPLATSLALYLLMLQSLLCFNLNTHLQPTTFYDGEGGTKTQVACLVRASNSLFMALHHC